MSWGDTLLIGGSVVASVTSIVAAGAAAFGLRSAASATNLSRKVSAAQLILELDDQIARFNDVQEEVRADRIADVESWKLSRYMGTLERLKLVMDSTEVSAAEISKLHGFRFRMLSATERVQRRMQKRGWEDFSFLVEQTKPYWSRGEDDDVVQADPASGKR
jgi:hypothetical protein